MHTPRTLPSVQQAGPQSLPPDSMFQNDPKIRFMKSWITNTAIDDPPNDHQDQIYKQGITPTITLVKQNDLQTILMASEMTTNTGFVKQQNDSQDAIPYFRKYRQNGMYDLRNKTKYSIDKSPLKQNK